VRVAALDVFGLEAKSVWGQQWIKMLALLYEGVTVGLGGGILIGGQSAEGRAARARVQLEVERIMSSSDI
jgi:nucleoporin GLE1